MSPVRPCIGCGELIDPPASHCGTCDATRPTRHTPGRTSTAQARFRAEVLARAGNRCVVDGGARCEVRGAENLQAHHVHALADGGTNDPDLNGRAVCRPHHRAVEALGLTVETRGGQTLGPTP